jgi:hypothetical protein
MRNTFFFEATGGWHGATDNALTEVAEEECNCPDGNMESFVSEWTSS